MKRPPLFALAGLVATLAAPSPAAEPAWFLFSRHGECSSIAILNRKLPAIGDATTPDEIARRLRRRGEKVEVVDQPARNGEMRHMHLPKRGMSLIFVTGTLCDSPNSGDSPAR